MGFPPRATTRDCPINYRRTDAPGGGRSPPGPSGASTPGVADARYRRDRPWGTLWRVEMDFLAHARTRFRTCGLLALVAILAALSLKLAASASATTFAPQATLTANDEIGKSLLGSAVALSHDGDT